MRKQTFCICENKGAEIAKLISAFVFAARIVQFLYFLHTKFPASGHLLCLCSSVCVKTVWKPHCWFCHEAAQMSDTDKIISINEERETTVAF